jgi:exosortase
MKKRYTHRTAFLLHGLWLIGYFFSSKEVWISLIEKWSYSGTYSHGFFVFILSALLIYFKKEKTSSLAPAFNHSSLIVLFFCSIFYFFFMIFQWKLGLQFSIIGFLIGSVSLFWGKEIFLQIRFPLFFLLISLPIGYELIPLFQSITMQCVQAGLWLFSIPAWQEGHFITTNAGLFEIGPSCSGFRYVIATVAFSLVYCYWQDWALKYRVLFITGALLIAVLANGIRAAFIVIWASYSDAYCAIALDHEIYGWIFFIFILLWLLIFLRCFPKKISRESKSLLFSDTINQYSISQVIKTFFLAYLLCASMILCTYLLGVEKNLDLHALKKIQFPQHSNFMIAQSNEWPIEYAGYDTAIYQGYFVENKLVMATLVMYQKPNNETSLVQFQNKPYKTGQWSMIEEVFFEIQGERYKRTQIKQGLEKRTLITWYYLNGISTPYKWLAKVIEGFQRFFRKPAYSVAIVLMWEGDWLNNQHAIEVFSPWMRRELEREFEDRV